MLKIINKKDPLKYCKLSIFIISMVVLALGIFIVIFGFLAIFTGVTIPKSILTAFMFEIKFAYGCGLTFEFIFFHLEIL